jgi:hypothetical protein
MGEVVAQFDVPGETVENQEDKYFNEEDIE